MLALFLALLVAGSAADIPIAEPAYLCPGSPSSANHWAKVEALVFAYCDSVRDEIIARVDLQESGHWHSPHLRGIYSLLDRSRPRSLLLASAYSRSQDLIGFTLADLPTARGPACSVLGCSQSQLYTYTQDDSDQYCNIAMLYCGKSLNCKPAISDFQVQEVKVKTSGGGGATVARCFRPQSGWL